MRPFEDDGEPRIEASFRASPANPHQPLVSTNGFGLTTELVEEG
jgi:hypothetical protein